MHFCRCTEISPRNMMSLRKSKVRKTCAFCGERKLCAGESFGFPVPSCLHPLQTTQGDLECWNYQVLTSGPMLTGSLLFFIKSAGV
jgi:hypothetical protein